MWSIRGQSIPSLIGSVNLQVIHSFQCIEGVCTPASGPSGAITDADGSSTGDRIGRPLNGVGYGRRVRPGRRSTVNPVKTTSLSTIEVTNIETEGPTTGAVADAESEADTIRAKIVFPND